MAVDTFRTERRRSVTGAAAAVFVGRRNELAALSTELNRARGGEPRLVLVTGESGSGKTTLLTEFVSAVADVDSAVIYGDEAETTVPFGVIAQLPGINAGAGPDGAEASDAVTVAARVVEALSRSGECPVLLVVDDAQWADPSSLQALLIAFRRLTIDALLLVIVCRDVVAAAIPRGLWRLVADGRGTHLEVRGLTEPDLDGLSVAIHGHRLSPGARRTIWRHTSGHPMWAEAVIRHMNLDELSAVDPHQPLPPPQPLSALVLARLGRCSEPARRLVHAVAVADGPVRFADAARTAGLETPVKEIDEAIARDLIRGTGAPSEMWLDCPHPLIRAAIYHSLPITDRTTLHLAAATQATDIAVRLRHRVAASVGHDAALAAAVADHARSEQARGAWASAATAMSTAARIGVPGPIRQQRIVAAAQLWLIAGDSGEAARLADLDGGLGDSARADLVLGTLALNAGQYEDARRQVNRAWARADPGAEADVRAAAATQLSHICLMLGEATDGAEWAERALAALPPGAEAGSTRGLLAMHLAISGRTEHALSALAFPASSNATRDRCRVATGRGIVRLFADDLAGALADLSSVIATEERLGSSSDTVHCLGNLAEAEYRIGAWDAAVAHGDQALTLGLDTDQIWLEACVRSEASPVLARRGQWAAADEHIAAATRAAERTGDGSSLGYAITAAARLAHSRGDYRAIITAAEQLERLDSRDGIDEPGVFDWRPLYAEALVRVGRVSDAEQHLLAFEGIARDRNRLSALAGAARVRGILEAHRGRHATSRAAFALGAEQYLQVRMPFERAYTELCLAESLTAAGDRSAAGAHLRTAADIFLQLRARPFVVRAQRHSEQLGIAIKAAPGQSIELTAKELAVARLVGSGLTNLEASRKLFVTAKTVEFHLGNMYRKLDIRTRTDLAIWWHRRYTAE